MTKVSQDTAMGVGIALVSLMLLFREQWFLTHTHKGQTLVKWFGDRTATWVLRGVLAAAAVLGGLLAGGMVRPVHWGFYDRRRQCQESIALAARAAFATPSSSSSSAVWRAV